MGNSRSRLRRVVGLYLLAAMLGAPLVYSYSQSSPVSLQTTEGEATISFAANRGRVEFPGQCLVVRWEVGGIRTVSLNDWPQVGVGEEELCTNNVAPVLKVGFVNGTSRSYPLEIEYLYQTPVGFALLLAACLAACAAGYTLAGVPGMLVTLTVLVGGPMIRSLANQGPNFLAHTLFAGIALETQSFSALPPHFLYHVLIILLTRISPPLSFENASFIVALSAYVITVLAVFYLMRWIIGQPPQTLRSSLVYLALIISLMFIGPISLLTDQLDGSERSAFIYPNTFISPTLATLRPFAVTLFFAVVKLMDDARRPGWKIGLLLGVLTVLSVAAKPNFALALLPSVALVVGYSFLKSSPLDRKVLIGGILVPGALFLFWQYLYWYGGGDQNGTVFAPLELLVTWWEVPWVWIVPQFVLSILFPLCVYMLYWRQARHDVAFNFAGLLFLIGVAPTYLFVEVPGHGNGNFVWGGQITLFLLFVVATAFFVRQNADAILAGQPLPLNKRFYLCVAAYALHGVSQLLVLI